MLRLARCWRVPPGNAAGCISCAMSWPTSRTATSRWWRPPCEPSLPNLIAKPAASNSRECAGHAAALAQAARLVAEAEEDVLAYMAFPPEHWTRIYSTNPLERLNKEIKRRTNVVGIFPDEDATIRLIGAVLLEQSRRVGGRPALLQPRIDAPGVGPGGGAVLPKGPPAAAGSRALADHCADPP